MTALLTVLLTAFFSAGASGFTPQQLWQAWPEERFVATDAPCLRPAELEESLRALEARHPDALRLEVVGRSFLGRPIHLVTIGRGSQKILVWSQMHGDEPSATPALLDIVDYLLAHRAEPAAEKILDAVTLLMIPMLNPDGAEIYQRRNAQGIDINRDALNLATPEGRLLKRIRDQHDPILGFNLHDQNRRTAVGDTGVLATNAVLAVSGDPEGTLTAGRERAMRACAAIVEALAPFMPGGMARYDEEWSPRAFGDNLTAWGTPVVLIESGGLPPGRELSELTRLNFVAILTVLQDFVRNDLSDHDPEVYEELPRNQSDSWSDVAVRNGFLLQPGTTTPYRSDLSINLLRGDRQMAGCAAGEVRRSEIFEIGDGRFIAAGRNLDASDSLILSPFEAAVKGWSARKWLDGEALSRLARSGVGRVRWQIKDRHLARARARARLLNAPGHALLEVVPRSALLPWLTVDRPPPRPESDSLADLLGALGGKRMRRRIEDLSPEDALQSLWPTRSRAAVGKSPIGVGQPASFLLVSPADEGRIDLETARLKAVWIDGHEVRAVP